jgi:CubicO group peptidase (beta-lactamase class C family)
MPLRLVLLAMIGSAFALPSFRSPVTARVQRTVDITKQQPFAKVFGDLEREPHHDLNGVIVVRRDVIVAEHYFNGEGPESLHDIRSATKSITSTLAGIAIDRHVVKSVHEPLTALVPGLTADKRAIRLEDLLTMRSGLAADDDDPSSPGNEVLMDQSDSWTAFARSVPLKTAPGGRYLYCSLNAFLAGAAIEVATGQRLDDVAKAWLFAPLGITQYSWRHGPDGPVAGQGNLRLRLRDMATFGSMILHEGVGGGNRVVSRQWVRSALAARVPISDVDPYADSYGYMWYTKRYARDNAEVAVHFASGNGGNKIYVIPADQAVIAITSSAYNTTYGQRRSEQILLDLLSMSRRPMNTVP